MCAGRPPKDGVYRPERVAAVLGYRLASDGSGSGKPRLLEARQLGHAGGGSGSGSGAVGGGGGSNRPWNDVLEGALTSLAFLLCGTALPESSMSSLRLLVPLCLPLISS